jgi:hypothetical protein
VYRKENGCGKNIAFIMMRKLLGLNMCLFWLSIKEEEEET